jgi:hypothetical protein
MWPNRLTRLPEVTVRVVEQVISCEYHVKQLHMMKMCSYATRTVISKNDVSLMRPFTGIIVELEEVTNVSNILISACLNMKR